MINMVFKSLRSTVACYSTMVYFEMLTYILPQLIPIVLFVEMKYLCMGETNETYSGQLNNRKKTSNIQVIIVHNQCSVLYELWKGVIM